MYEYKRDERIIPRGWPSQRGGCISSLGFVGRLLEGGGLGSGGVVVVRHGVGVVEGVDEAAGFEAEDGEESGAVAPRRSPKTLSAFSRGGPRRSRFRRHLLTRTTVHAVERLG